MIRYMGAVFFALSLLASPGQAKESAWLIDIKGAIGPATADHTVRGLEQAEAASAQLVILRIDTPGGLDAAMRDIIQGVLASSIPVVAYVAPGGARAASAGTYILYASHIAAMAPATNLGSATPVNLAPKPSLPINRKPSTEEDSTDTGSAMEKKIINDAAAYITSLAELRGRNAEWASQAVREGASVSAEQALELGVIEILAPGLDELLAQLDGRKVQIDEKTLTLSTASTAVYKHPVDWRSEFLAVITNPNIAYLLMMAGIYGLLIEFYNPGLGLPGVLGGVCLLLALYALQVLPISYAALGLIILGIALMSAEAFAPSFGVLGLGGIAAFIIGSIMLMDTSVPAFQIALPMILAFALFSAGLLVFGLGMILKARKQQLVSGLNHLLGTSATIEALHNDMPMARLEGELWQVRCNHPLEINDTVTIDRADGVILDVTKNNGE